MAGLMVVGRAGLRAALVVVLSLAVGLAGGRSEGAKLKGSGMSYGEAKQFLTRHTKVVELADPSGARVAICPAWQGRVMTSTCDGLEGLSFGFINREFVEAGKSDPHFSNYGAEDRMWLSPEGGPFSLWFKPGVPQTLADWYTPPAMNEGPFEVQPEPTASSCRMARPMQLENASATKFDLAASREVRLLTETDLTQLFGPAAKIMAQPGVKRVAYETVNAIANRGAPLTKQKGLVSIWMLGMLNCGPKSVVMVPYRSGDESQLGPVVKSDYFGPVPSSRLKILPEAILFRADGKYRSKIGTSQKRAKNVLGSIDFDANVLSLVQFSMPGDPTKCDYMNNQWGPQTESYLGDVANSYNDGPPAPGKKGLGAFYEIESLSPAAALGTGQSLTHHHRTIHIQADRATLARLAKDVLGVDLGQVESTMFPK